MEIFNLDFSLLLISLILASVIFIYYIFLPKVADFNCQSNDGFAVIDVVKVLKKACPVQYNNKWKLLPLNYGSVRCWTKSISIPGIRNCIKLYGATCAVTCSSMYAFSSIADVSKWGEWEPSQSQSLPLRVFDVNKIKKDNFMQANQIAGIQRGTNIQSYVALYRFLSLQSKITKWILFWNAKKFEFMFFIIQPATCRKNQTQCVVTHLYGTDHLLYQTPYLVAQRMRNINEYLYLSQLHVRPLALSQNSVPSPIELSFDKEEVEKEDDLSSVFLPVANCDRSKSVFMLVPLFHCLKFTMKILKGFNLELKETDEKPPRKKPKRKANPPKSLNLQLPLRRAVSDMNLSAKTSGDFFSSLKSTPVQKDRQLAAVSVQNDLNKSCTDTVAEDMEWIDKSQLVNGNDDCILQQPPPRAKTRSFSDGTVENSKFYTKFSGTPSGEDSLTSLHSISETEENARVEEDNNDKNELFCSSTSEFEVLDTNQQYIDTRLAGYLTQGNFAASVLQREMMLASQFDKTMHTGSRVAGGWIHCSTHKGIPVLTKCTSGKIIKIISFLCQSEIPVNYKDVWKCVKNPRFRFISDETVKTVQIIDRISDSQKLVHIYHEISGILRKEAIDFCLLQTEREEQNTFYSVFQSIEYERCPFMIAVVRGCLKPSGWIVQNLTPKSCKVTYLIQILVNSPDNVFIQELNVLVPQSLLNLKQYITAKPK